MSIQPTLNESITLSDGRWQQAQADLDAINRARVSYLYGRTWGYTLPAYPLELIVWMVNQSISEGTDDEY
jgi:hypothetical protein